MKKIILGVALLLLSGCTKKEEVVVQTVRMGVDEIKTETVVSGLDTPWAMAKVDSENILVSERGGAISKINLKNKTKEQWAVVEVYEKGEAGLMGIALDPGFAKNGVVYAMRTVNENGEIKNQIIKLVSGRVDKVILDNIPGADNHNGGRVKIGMDGKLYVTTGEKYVEKLAQEKTSLGGKILRLNLDGSVPEDNPIKGSYIYSYGHRNPQGIVFFGSEIWSTEHGPSVYQGCCRDELNKIVAGGNYGWNIVSGDKNTDGMIAPVLQSGDNATWAPGGLDYVATGPWAGSLVFVGLRGQALYRYNIATKQFSTYLDKQFGRLRDVLVLEDGSMLIATSNKDGRGKPEGDDDKIIRVSFKNTK